MKPPDFEYARPTSVSEAVATLASSNGEGKVLAGGQSLVPLMNFRLAAPRLLVDLNRIPNLAFIERSNGTLRIGAMTRTRALELDPLVRQTVPILAAGAAWVGHVQIRNRGTVGGSLAHADPAAELPAICLLLDAELVVVGPDGERSIPAADFMLGFLTTSLAEDEILTEIRVPIPATGARWAFREFAQRRGDFALAGAAVLHSGASAGNGSGADPTRVVVFGTADRPVRATDAESVLGGEQTTPDLIDEAARVAANVVAADDARPDAAYRQALTETLVSRVLRDVSETRQGSDRLDGDGGA
jgi:aerobic carbon-monoxide dehydrogenase medium subunit